MLDIVPCRKRHPHGVLAELAQRTAQFRFCASTVTPAHDMSAATENIIGYTIYKTCVIYEGRTFVCQGRIQLANDNKTIEYRNRPIETIINSRTLSSIPSFCFGPPVATQTIAELYSRVIRMKTIVSTRRCNHKSIVFILFMQSGDVGDAVGHVS